MLVRPPTPEDNFWLSNKITIGEKLTIVNTPKPQQSNKKFLSPSSGVGGRSLTKHKHLDYLTKLFYTDPCKLLFTIISFLRDLN